MYQHKCEDCGFEWETKSNTKARWCKTHQRYHVGTSTISTGATLHSFICVECKLEFQTKRNPNRNKTGMCGDCSRRDIGKRNRNTTKPKKVYFRICEDCGDKKEVTSLKSAKKKKCRSCGNKGTTRQTSKARIEKLKEQNRLHREEVERNKKTRIKLMSPEDMRAAIDEFYESNDVIHIDCIEPYGESTLQIKIGN